MQMLKVIMLCLASFVIVSCTSFSHNTSHVDILIKSGLVYSGDNKQPEVLDIAICKQVICFVGENLSNHVASKVIDAKGYVVTPGFIDPHTHSLAELISKDKRNNLNYLTQGVTTVINGNDGEGSFQIEKLRQKLNLNGIGTNVGLLVGHGAIRQQVMGLSNKAASNEQLIEMRNLLTKAMAEGGLGFSTGLYYVPGRYADTEEVIFLAKEAAKYNGIYDTHIRDESTFNIGYIESIREVIEIAQKAQIRAHIAHIKALGVDVWGQSQQAIQLIEQARRKGLEITADQYPWQASGTFLHNAVIPSWVMADSTQAFHQRLNSDNLRDRIIAEINENIRRRGGAKALLVTASKEKSRVGKTLQELADKYSKSAAEYVIELTLQEAVRVASFNMDKGDIENFMRQPWVVSSSDGTDGHPRKYASFPNKYQQYVSQKKVISLQEFIHRSSAKTAEIFNLKKRGSIKPGYFADINIIDIENYKPAADFSHWNRLSTGITYQLINGELVISNSRYTGALAGTVL